MSLKIIPKKKRGDPPCEGPPLTENFAPLVPFRNISRSLDIGWMTACPAL